MTHAGYCALQEELKRRVQIDRVRLIERMRQAIADDSNLAENSEYQNTQSKHQINDARIAELEDKLARAEIIDVSRLSGDVITFGATVTLIDEENGGRKVLHIVGESEADVREGKISLASPIARALIGKATGTTVEVEGPRGSKIYKNFQVDWPHTR